MAKGLTTYGTNALCDHLSGKATFTTPNNMYIGLSKTTISADGTGITEPSGGAYARYAMPKDTSWTAASGGMFQNVSDLVYPTATASWGTIVALFLADASTGGNIIAFAPLEVSKAIDSGDTAKFIAGSVVFALLQS